jgi:hypothetical protein
MRLWYRNIERAPGRIEPRVIIEEHPGGPRDHAREATIVGACIFRTSPLDGTPPHSWIEVAPSAQVTFMDRVTEPIHGY